jgi:sensor histidine kinase YesM
LCRLYEKTKDYSQSIIEGNKALEAFDVSEFPLIYYDISLSMLNANIALGNYKEAYKYYTIKSTIKDSTNAAAKLEVVKNLEMKYESEKKEQRILTLNKEKKGKNILIAISFVGLLILSGFLVFAIRSKKLQRKLLIKEKEIQKKEMEQNMFELQQTALRAQMNPHFIFNCLNSVQRFVINNDVKGVNAYLSAFASLIRQTLENSGKPDISLKKELQYLETYIIIEQMRSGGNFDYEINVENNIDLTDVYIPNMIIQPFVENSILYGLKGKPEIRGRLRLVVSKEKELIFVVEDNGVGIKNSIQSQEAGEKDHESMGHAITEKRIALYNSSHEKKIKLQIVDRSDAGTYETGTKIILKFPLSN